MTEPPSIVPARGRPTGRPRGSIGGRTREEALAVAMALFAETGFRGTSLQRVAEEAGLSQAGLLHHFGSKAQLLADVLQRRDDLDASQGGEAQRIGFDAFDALLTVVRRNATTPGLVRLYVTLSGEATEAEHPGHAWLDGHLSHVVASLQHALEAGIAAGIVAPATPCREIAQAFTAMIDGLQVQWLMRPAEIDMVAAAATFVQAARLAWAATDPSQAPAP